MDNIDWDDSSTKITSAKIFGGRGRGFLIPKNYKPEKKVAEWSSQRSSKENNDYYHDDINTNEKMSDWKNENDNWYEWGNQGKDNKPYDKEWNGSRNKDNQRNNNGGGHERRPRERGFGKGEDGSKPSKPNSNYIPQEPTEDESEIFGNSISSGINFSKYDDIKVTVSGENPSAPIHSFENCGLHSYLVDTIKKCNYNTPTPVQKYSIPTIMDGRDMMGCAQTGSGKTAAFLIPIINSLLENRQDCNFSESCKPQAVIVSPTRELTIQIFNEARKFSRGTFLKVGIAYGGTSVHYQIERITKGCHILTATTGRLNDFLNRGKIDLSCVKFVVLDEADRMLDMGFLPQIESLMAHETLVPQSERQTVMFSATFPEEIQRLAGKFLKNYVFVAVGIIGGACADVEQKFYATSRFEKRNKVVELMTEVGSARTLIFVEQKRTTDFIATFLCEKNFPATSIHGGREQREREEALNDFKSGRMNILVATSVAARGLDIKNVAHVINYDLPNSIDEYVHRIGRTGRVGNRGLATSFFDAGRDAALAHDLVKILTQAGQEVPDFLESASLGGGGVFDFSSKFGGKDFRNHGRSKKTVLDSTMEETFEEEVW